uniref:Uncharacterized protein n=1 Tax=Panagrolaimus sp. JU765 TaxID=591449 RepID=A0AC34Q3P3_9BILA
MGPLPEDSQKKVPKNVGDADNDDDNNDGWEVGYAVQMNGVGFDGIQNDDGRNNFDDSDSDGYEGPGDGSDAEIDEYRRAGYQQLPLNQPDEEETASNDKTSDSEEFSRFQEQISKASAPPVGTLPTTVHKEFQNALNS